MYNIIFGGKCQHWKVTPVTPVENKDKPWGMYLLLNNDK